jgi:acetyl-CoA carboxylase biotin carboxyl carrier protein
VESFGVSADELGQLLALVSASDITELDVTLGTTRVSIRRPAMATPAQASASDAEATVTPEPEPHALAIASPLVGIFHPVVKAGEAVANGQSIGAIEALGMPTSVDAPQSGTVEDLLVADGAAVEYGQPLLVLRRDSHAP